MIERRFQLAENGTTARREVISGVTTFLTMMYILFVNSSILAETGMPRQGVFVATAVTATVGTLMVALYSNLPLAMAPGMGLNTIFVHTICVGLGYHWKEALAIAFMSGLLHLAICSTPLRKAFVNAFPAYLRVASGVGLGIFIAYVGIKNSGLLEFTLSAGSYVQLDSGVVIGDSSAVPGMVRALNAPQVIAMVGLVIMVALTAMEKKTGDRYAALPVGIIAATFVGIPLNITRLDEFSAMNTFTALGEFGGVLFSFFGNPGLLSVFSDPIRTANTLLMVLVLSMTDFLSSIGTMVGVGQIDDAVLFDERDMKKFAESGGRSKLDRALFANSTGSMLAPLFGSSTSTIYLESITGIMAGGRTGLTGVVTGALFMLCLPFAGFLTIIPGEAVAPALILAGASMITQIRRINWKDFEQCLPAFFMITFKPLAFGLLDGIAIGVICHVVIQLASGKRRSLNPVLIVISVLYAFIKLGERYLFV